MAAPDLANSLMDKPDHTYTPPDHDTVRVIEVIQTTTHRRGCGTKENPLRTICRYYALDGTFLAEYDAHCPPPEEWPLGTTFENPVDESGGSRATIDEHLRKLSSNE